MLDTTQPQRYNAYDRPHEDLREFVERAEGAGELMRVSGASPELEMGTLAEIVYHTRPEPPAILFEHVTGYPAGRRLQLAPTTSSTRVAIALGASVPGHAH